MPLGHWRNATDGHQQWQWQIHSPGAESHLLIFRSAMMCSMWDHAVMRAAWTSCSCSALEQAPMDASQSRGSKYIVSSQGRPMTHPVMAL